MAAVVEPHQPHVAPQKIPMIYCNSTAVTVLAISYKPYTGRNPLRLLEKDGWPGESRTPDQRFRNWAVIPQLVCFQCLQFGQFRAVLGSVGSGTCNGSCNAGRGWPSLSISIPHDRTVPASSERGQIRNLLLTTYSIYLQLVCRPVRSITVLVLQKNNRD